MKNRKLFLIALLSITLQSCKMPDVKRLWEKYFGDEKESTSETQSESASESVSESESKKESVSEKASESESISESTSEVSKKNDGLSISTAYTIDELLTKVSNFQDKQISTSKYYIQGKVASSSYNATYKSYTAYFEGHEKGTSKPVCVYSGTLDSSIKDTYTKDNALKGATIVVYGYVELFSGTYEIPYLASKYSPTGKTENAVIKSISGGTKDSSTSGQTETGSAGSNASFTGSLPSSYDVIVLDFDRDYSTIDMPNGDNYGTGEVDIDGLTYGYINSKIRPSNEQIPENHLRLNSKDAKGVSVFYNVDAIPGTIVGIKVTMISKSSSTLAPYEFAILDSVYNGESVTTGTTGSDGKVFEIYPTKDFEGSYFAISVNQGVSGSGKASWYNGFIVTIEIYYVK